MLLTTKKEKCTLTGLSNLQLPFSEQSKEGEALKKRIENSILQAIEEGYVTFFCGMENGCELWTGEILLRLKKEHPLKVISVIASENRADFWSEDDRERYFDKLLPHVDEEIYTSRTNDNDAILYRNQFLAKRTDLLIAVDNGADISDVADMIRRCQKLKKEVRIIEINSIS